MQLREGRGQIGLMASVVLIFALLGTFAHGAETPGGKAITADPEISINTLKVKLRPLEVAQLEVELAAWVDLLKSKITEVGLVEIEVEESQIEESQSEDTEDQDELEEKEKDGRSDELIDLRTAETDLIERTKVVMEALAAKGGDISETASFLSAITDLSSTGDTQTRAAALIAAVNSWMKSPDGGVKMLRRVILALAIFFVFWVISRYAGRVVAKGLKMRANVSDLLTNFARKMSGLVVLFIGALMALAALGVSIGPLMAALGAGGFIVGFALQETLANFSSGLMIMIYRPFDVGDYVSVSGSEGVVREMSLVSTTLLTLDNKVLIIPNRSVFGSTITNYTGEDIRRVDLSFGIGYGDNIPEAMVVLEEMAKAHPLTLDEPGISVEVLELGDSSVNLACWPWVKTSNYWKVKWELTRQIKMRFDEEGISIPFPQRDVHMIQD